jgi:MFS transporter, DHA1 family, multidrug resistance protein
MSHFPKPKFLDQSTPPHILTLILLAGLSPLSMNFFLPSLPSMSLHFQTSPTVLGLSVGIFLASSAIFQIVVGPFSDHFGRRPIVLGSLIIFILVTFMVPFVTTTKVFLILRALQAAAAACMVTSRAIVRDTTTSAEESGQRISYVTMGMAVAPMLGLSISGFIDSWFGWEANFWILGCVGAVVLVICYFDQAETLKSKGASLKEQMRQYPELLRSHRFWGYCLSSALGSGAFFAFLGGAPYVGSELFKLNPENLGLYISVTAVGYFLGNYLSGRYSIQVGIDMMVYLGLIIAVIAISCSLTISFLGHGSAFSFFGLMSFTAMGNGLTMPNAAAGMMSVRPDLAGTASGLGGSITIAGGAALSSAATIMLGSNSTETPLVFLMWLSVIGGLFCILLVQRRNKKLGIYNFGQK